MTEWMKDWTYEVTGPEMKKEDQQRTADSEDFRPSFAAADKFLTRLWRQSLGLSPAEGAIVC